MLDRRFRVREAATVGKTVGGDVDDAHDARTIERQAGQRWPPRADPLEDVGMLGVEGAAVAGPQLGKRHGFAEQRAAAPLDDLDGGEIVGAIAAQRQRAGKLAAAVTWVLPASGPAGGGRSCRPLLVGVFPAEAGDEPLPRTADRSNRDRLADTGDPLVLSGRRLGRLVGVRPLPRIDLQEVAGLRHAGPTLPSDPRSFRTDGAGVAPRRLLQRRQHEGQGRQRCHGDRRTFWRSSTTRPRRR